MYYLILEFNLKFKLSIIIKHTIKMLIILSSTLRIENSKVIIEETPTNFKTVKNLIQSK